jgi:glycosyltransferase involved in cell wall biosynthesis
VTARGTAPVVLIPVHNEAASLPALVSELRDDLPGIDILVVDDRSSDATPETLRRLDVAWLRLPVRLGIGGAMRAGLRYAASAGHELVVRVDGDGQHVPASIPRLLAPVLAATADAVQGTRYAEPDGYRATGARRAAQRALAAALSGLTGRRVSDPTSGFWAFGPRAVRVLARHHPTGYPEPELILLLHHHALHVAEVPVAMRARTAGRTSLTTARAAHALARLALATAAGRARHSVVSQETGRSPADA